MKVIVVVNFEFRNDVGKKVGVAVYEKAIEMPVAPVNVGRITLRARDLPIHCEVKLVAWSESLSAFIVTTECIENEYYLEVIKESDDWKELSEFHKE